MMRKSIFGAVAVLCLSAVPAHAQSSGGSGSGSVLNILLLAVVAYLVVRMFRRRFTGGDDKRPEDRPAPRNGDAENHTQDDAPDNGNLPDKRPNTPPDNPPEQPNGDARRPAARPADRYEAARQMWTVLGGDGDGAQRTPGPALSGKASFDEREFLEGAKLFYTRLQQAADVTELDGLRDFLSEAVYRQSRAAMESGPWKPVTVVLLDARLTDVQTEAGRTVASVAYQATLGGGEPGGQPLQRHAVWKFSRDERVENGLWTLDEIENMDQ